MQIKQKHSDKLMRRRKKLTKKIEWKSIQMKYMKLNQAVYVHTFVSSGVPQNR